MGITKTDIYTDEQNKLAILLKAIAHPARIAILQQIIKSDTCICGDLVAELGLAQPTVSQHLKELKNAGLIEGSIEGSSVCYCVNEAVWNGLGAELVQFFASYSLKEKCC